jgi:hypothetical protein
LRWRQQRREKNAFVHFTLGSALLGGALIGLAAAIV